MIGILLLCGPWSPAAARPIAWPIGWVKLELNGVRILVFQGISFIFHNLSLGCAAQPNSTSFVKTSPFPLLALCFRNTGCRPGASCLLWPKHGYPQQAVDATKKTILKRAPAVLIAVLHSQSFSKEENGLGNKDHKLGQRQRRPLNSK